MKPIKFALIILSAIFCFHNLAAAGIPKLSMVITYPGEPTSWTLEVIQQAYSKAKEAGIRVANYYYSWGEIETQKGKYNWRDADFINFIKSQGVELSVEIKLVDVNKVGLLPKDIKFSSFNSPVFKKRFKDFILTFLDRYSGKIDYLWIGNEVDLYFYTHRNQIDGYAQLYSEVVSLVKEKYPGIKLGVVSTYHDAKNHQAFDIIETIGRHGDLLGFSLYPQMLEIKDLNVEDYFAEMSKIINKNGKKFAILETGLSSEGFAGSETKQSQYIRDLFDAYSKYQSDIEFLGLFVLYDLPDSLNRAVAASYGIEKHEDFLKFQGSLGLLDNNGRPKQAWAALGECISGAKNSQNNTGQIP